MIFDKLLAGEILTFSRWGDGEWACVLQTRPGQKNTDGTFYVPEMGKELEKILAKQCPTNYYFGVQGLAMDVYGQEINSYIAKHNITKTWIDSDEFHKLSINKCIQPFWDWLATKKVLLVAPDYIKKQTLFPVVGHISVPPANIYPQVGRIVAECDNYPDADVILVVASIPAEIIIDRLYDKRGATTSIIDMGSVIDPFVGKNCRSYHWMLQVDKQKVAVVVSSCEKYSQYWDGFAKHWEQFPTELGWDVHWIIDKGTPPMGKAIYTARNWGEWSDGICDGVRQIDCDYLLFMMEDVWIVNPLSHQFFTQLLGKMMHACAVRGDIQSGDQSRYATIHKGHYAAGIQLYKLNDTFPWAVNLSPAIWKKEHFMKCLPPKSNPRDLENNGKRIEGCILLANNTQWTTDVCRYGKATPDYERLK